MQAFGEFIRLYISRYERWSFSAISAWRKLWHHPRRRHRRIPGRSRYRVQRRNPAFDGRRFPDARMEQVERPALFAAGADFQHDRRLSSQAARRSHAGHGENARRGRALVDQRLRARARQGRRPDAGGTPQDGRATIALHRPAPGSESRRTTCASTFPRSPTNCCSIRNCAPDASTAASPAPIPTTSVSTIPPAPRFCRHTPRHSTITCVPNSTTRSDMPYKVFAYDERGFQNWDWGNAVEGFPSTAGGLRSAMIKNPYMKILVMEGYYDLATPFAAADWTMDHLNLRRQVPPEHLLRHLRFRPHGVRRPRRARQDEEGSGQLHGEVPAVAPAFCRLSVLPPPQPPGRRRYDVCSNAERMRAAAIFGLGTSLET